MTADQQSPGWTGLTTALQDPSPPLIYPLLADSGNERVLRQWLDEHDEYRAVEPGVTLEDAEFDLCIVDHRALQRNEETLRRLKSAANPVLLPVLLLLPDRRLDVIDVDGGEIAENVFQTTVDEIVSLPIKQAELGWRVQAMLRLRNQSLTVQAQANALRRFREAVEASGHAVYITNLSGEIEYVNPAFEEVTGYSADEAVGATPELLNSETTSEAYIESMWNTILDGDVWEEEIVNERKDGSTYTAYQTIAPIVKGGEPIAFVSMQADVTEQKELRRELGRSAAIIERLDDPIMMQDCDGEFKLLNEAVTEYAGLSKATLLGEDETPFMDDATASTIGAKKSEVLETETPVQYELSPTFPRTGREPTFSTKRFPYYDPDGNLAGTVAICRNVTDLKQRERTLRQYKRAITEANDLIAAVDLDGEYLFANPQYREYHGLSAAEVSSLSLSELFDDEEYATIVDSIERTLNGDTVQYRTVRHHPSRGERVLDVRYHPLRGEDGEVIGVVGVLRDVTENEEKTTQLRVVDQILRHNLRNSLQLVRGQAERISSAGDEDVAEMAAAIVEWCDELLTTSQKSRAITESLSKTVSVRETAVDEVVETAAASVAESYPSARIDLNIERPATAAATEQLNSAITELIENAVFHSDQEEPTVEVCVEHEGERILIHIEDNGPGIPAMDRDVLETGKATEDLYHGSGLGLWLVYWILRRSGGSVSVENREPRGSVVTISLPAVE